MRIKYLLIVLLLMSARLFVACTHKNIDSDNNETEIIDISQYVNGKLWNPTKYEYNGYVIKLETAENCLLPRINNVFFSENHIYIKASNRQVFIFDSKGNYINKLKLGNGPGEIARMIDACYDAEKNELIVYQDPYIKYYTSDGIFKYEKEIPYFFVKMCSIKQGYILKSNMGYMRYAPMPDATLIFIDKNFESPKAFLDKQVDRPISSNMSLSYDVETGIVTIPSNTDTIYYFKNGALNPAYYAKYPKNNNDGPDLFILAENYLETSDFQYFGFINKGMLNVFRDKKTGNIIAGRIEETEKSAFVTSPIAVYEDYFVCVKTNPTEGIVYKNSDLFSSEDLEKINNQKEDDNPLLIFFKLKPFDGDEE